MEEANLGKVIEKIIGKIKKDELAKEVEEAPSEIPSTSEPSAPLPISPPPAPEPEPEPEPVSAPPKKVFLKASQLHSLGDLGQIKAEVEAGNIMIVKIGPLAQKNVEDVKKTISELCEFTEKTGGDIARLGEDRVVVTPSLVKIWRENLRKGESKPSTEV